MEEWSKRCAQYRPKSGAFTAMVGKYLATLGQLERDTENGQRGKRHQQLKSASRIWIFFLRRRRLGLHAHRAQPHPPGKSHNTAPNEIIQERLKHNSLDHLQHQAKQYSNESHTIPHRTKSYRNGSNITLWTTYSTKPSSTVTKSYNTAPNEIIQERLKHNSLDHLQHQAKQYSNEVIQYRTERDHTGTAQT